MNKKKSLLFISLCLTFLLISYAVAEYVLNIPNTCQIVVNASLEITWVSNGQPVTNYDWGTMNDITKDMTPIKIRNIGNSQLSVFWSTPDLPSGFQLKAYKPTVWDQGLVNAVILAKNANLTVTWQLKDMGAAVGTHSFTIVIQSQA
jgi:hypothetical protein